MSARTILGAPGGRPTLAVLGVFAGSLCSCCSSIPPGAWVLEEAASANSSHILSSVLSSGARWWGKRRGSGPPGAPPPLPGPRAGPSAHGLQAKTVGQLPFLLRGSHGHSREAPGKGRHGRPRCCAAGTSAASRQQAPVVCRPTAAERACCHTSSEPLTSCQAALSLTAMWCPLGRLGDF